MINTPAIANLIRERKISQIYSQLQTGSKDGMNTLEQCLQRLLLTKVKSASKRPSGKRPIPKHYSAMTSRHDSIRQLTKHLKTQVRTQAGSTTQNLEDSKPGINHQQPNSRFRKKIYWSFSGSYPSFWKVALPLAQGMILIAENMTNAKLAYCVQTIAFRLNAGEELSSSLRQYPKVFEPIAIGLIEAGEAGGILEQVLDRIALLLEERAKIRGQIIGALIYPALVLILAVSVSLGLLIFIVPKFKSMFDGMGAELPALTSFMLNLSNFVTSPTFATRRLRSQSLPASFFFEVITAANEEGCLLTQIS